MKRNYKNVELEIIFFCTDDIIRTSENVSDLPEFPEVPEDGNFKS